MESPLFRLGPARASSVLWPAAAGRFARERSGRRGFDSAGSPGPLGWSREDFASEIDVVDRRADGPASPFYGFLTTSQLVPVQSDTNEYLR